MKINKIFILILCLFIAVLLIIEKDTISNYFFNYKNINQKEINKELIKKTDINKELIIENKESEEDKINYEKEKTPTEIQVFNYGYAEEKIDIDDASIIIKKNNQNAVQFIRQAPFGNWEDDKQQNGCEEAASIMAVYWAQDKKLTLEIAEKEIIKISDFQLEKYGSFADTSSEDTVKRILNEYFNFYNAEIKYNITIEDIINEIEKGNLLLVPTNGQKLKNPYYTQPGPTHHELVIKGYDKEMDEFITNDSGTKYGESYRYKTGILWDAIYDYKTGKNEKVDEIIKAMIIIKK